MLVKISYDSKKTSEGGTARAKSVPDQFNKDFFSCYFLIKCLYERNCIESV